MSEYHKSKLIKISPELDFMLKQYAEAEHRSVANAIEHILLKFFEKKEGDLKDI